MNIYSYDPVNIKLDYDKTWIDYEKGMLYSREFKLKTYFFVATKFDKLTRSLCLYIVFTNIKPEDNRVYGYASLDKCGRFRTSIKTVLPKLNYRTESKAENVDISIDDEDEDSIAYRIHI